MRIRCEAEKAWLAAMIDGEGCILVSHDKKKDYYRSEIKVYSSDRELVEHCFNVAKCGFVGEDKRNAPDHHRQMYYWIVRTGMAAEVVKQVFPFLIAKQPQAALIYTLNSMKANKAEHFDKFAEIKALVSQLNQTRQAKLPKWVVYP